MKTIGLIGGMSWESTALYYQTINRETGRRLGKLHGASILLVSLDFENIAARQRAGDWAGLQAVLVDAAVRLERAGADLLLICTNTMHKLALEVQAHIGIPLLHIGDVTGAAIVDAGLSTVGLLGTRFTMEQPFYTDRLRRHHVDCLVPDEADRIEVHRIIFDELCKGSLNDESRRRLVRISADMVDRGAQGIVLGCTELPMLIDASRLTVPTFDTTALHAQAAVAEALAGIPGLRVEAPAIG